MLRLCRDNNLQKAVMWSLSKSRFSNLHRAEFCQREWLDMFSIENKIKRVIKRTYRSKLYAVKVAECCAVVFEMYFKYITFLRTQFDDRPNQNETG